MSTATTHIDNKPSLQASHCEDEGRSKRKQSHPLVPALRFKEFEGEWVKNKLIDWSLVVLDGDRGSNYPSGDEFQSEGYCLFMNAKNVTKTGFSFEHKMFITKEKDEILRKGKLKREDLVLTTRGSVGHIAYYDQSVPFDNLRINSGMVLIRNENDVISSKFIYINFFTPNLIRQVSTISFGSAQPQLTVKEINKFKFNIPSLPEQQKIASFLSAVDEKIQQLTKKKALLEQYKKGVMQQLFSGQLRFKDENGNPYPDWEEKQLGELCSTTTGKLDANAMRENGEYRFYTCAREYYQIDKYAFDTEALLVSGNGANVGYIHYYKGKFNAYQRTYVLDGFDQNIFYIKKYLEKNLYERIHVEKKDGNTPYITLSTLTEMKVDLPSQPEQQKIATYLSCIDTKIEAVNNQITQTQTFKKGLLQQMFV